MKNFYEMWTDLNLKMRIYVKNRNKKSGLGQKQKCPGPFFQILPCNMAKNMVWHKKIPTAMLPNKKQETMAFLCGQLKVIPDVSLVLLLSDRGHGNNNAAL